MSKGKTYDEIIAQANPVKTGPRLEGETNDDYLVRLWHNYEMPLESVTVDEFVEELRNL